MGIKLKFPAIILKTKPMMFNIISTPKRLKKEELYFQTDIHMLICEYGPLLGNIKWSRVPAWCNVHFQFGLGKTEGISNQTNELGPAIVPFLRKFSLRCDRHPLAEVNKAKDWHQIKKLSSLVSSRGRVVKF
ncbi:hypothetical protein COLO4_23678 [Corchorus olitorius]|uniref:Uncharacterized protein n=1 Tax=Corchorus olitorius TaxID=93759 RepID=A0A1R3IFG1_9ROSI|nr:hypothetical protein COLO4_23678 [Corchorus olitorius]